LPAERSEVVSARNVTVPTADGRCPASLHLPESGLPSPAVILFPDAGGLRDVFRAMGERLAGLGYVTLVPEPYYRHGEYAPFDMRSAFADPNERQRLMSLMQGLTSDDVVADAGAHIRYLLELPEVAGSRVGTTGYCMGGRTSLLVAGRHPQSVAAAASFHGGNLASDAPDSPHRNAADIKAEVYVAAAEDDGSFPPEQSERLDTALRTAGVRYVIETYPARHGFAVEDNATYDPAADERHWEALRTLFGDTLNEA
jgi:carboxymethylenebutenolidase